MNMSVQMSPILHEFLVQLRMLAIMLPQYLSAQSNINTQTHIECAYQINGHRVNSERTKKKMDNKMPPVLKAGENIPSQ